MRKTTLFLFVSLLFSNSLFAQTTITEALPTGVRDGINYVSDTKVTLVLFAPQKQNVYVLGDFNDFKVNASYLMKRTPDGNRYWIDLTSLKAGQEYAFQYLIDGNITIADPYAEKILDPVNDKLISATTYPNLKSYPTGAQGFVSTFQTSQTVYDWKVSSFTKPAQEKLVVYKLTMRDFLATHNFKALADTISYLKRLNVNVIDLMPIVESEGNDFLGLYPYYYTALDKALGTKNDFKAFVDKAHQNGIAVILTMPFQDTDFEFPYVKMYANGFNIAPNNPFFNQELLHPLTYGYDFNHESPATQNFMSRVCEYWLKEYKVDGFDLYNAVGYTQRNAKGNYSTFYNYDAGRATNIKRTIDMIKGFDKDAIVSLDFFINPTEMKEVANYGALIQTNMHAQYNFLQRGYESPLEMTRASFKAQGFQQPRILSWMENLFEERQMDILLKGGNAAGTYNTKQLQTAIERRKLSYALHFAFPGPVQLWQHEELGHDVSPETVGGADKQQPIKWEYAKDTDRQKLYRFVAELAKLKQNNPAFSTTDYKEVSGTLVQQITLKHSSNNVVFVGNFDVVEQKVKIDLPSTGKWTDYFSGIGSWFTTTSTELTLKPGEFHYLIGIPDNSTYVIPKTEQGLVAWNGQIGPPILANEPTLSEFEIIAFPNPTTEYLSLSLTNSYLGNVQFSIKDLAGRNLQTKQLVKTSQQLTTQFSTQQLATGLYFVETAFGDKKAVKKILKN